MRASFISSSDTRRQAEAMNHKQEKEKGGNQPGCGHGSLLYLIRQDVIFIHLFDYCFMVSKKMLNLENLFFVQEKYIFLY